MPVGELADAHRSSHRQQTLQQHLCPVLLFDHGEPLVVMPELYPAGSRYQLKRKALGIFSTWLKRRSFKAGLKLMFYVPGCKDGSAFYLLYMQKLWLIQP